MTKLPVAVFLIDSAQGPQQHVACLGHDTAFQQGLPTEALLGLVIRQLEAGEAIAPKNFAVNPDFVKFMHSVVARRAPDTPSFAAAAKRQGDGWVYVIDQRTPTPHDAVPPEDIIGVFAVKHGHAVSGSYQANPKHQIFTDRGFVQLGEEIQACLLDELNQLAEKMKP